MCITSLNQLEAVPTAKDSVKYLVILLQTAEKQNKK